MVNPKINSLYSSNDQGETLKDALDRYNARMLAAQNPMGMGSTYGAQNQQSLLSQYTQQSGAMTASIAQGNVGIGSGTAQRQRQERYLDPNDDPAYAPKISTIIDIWQLRYGDRWAKLDAAETAEDDAHIDRIAARLDGLGLLETTYRGGNRWCRLKEQHGNR